MSHNNPPIRNAVIATLKEHGPMTCEDTAGLMGWTVERVHGVISSARRLRPGQIFRVVRYQRAEGRGKDHSVYAASPGQDAPRPKVDKKVRRLRTQEDYRNRHRAIVNARNRMARAAKKGYTASANPWAQLAPREIRSFMTAVQRSA